MPAICSSYSVYTWIRKYPVWLFVLSLVISCSSPPEKKVDPGLSIEVKKILKRADTLSYYGHGKESVAYLDSAYRNLKNPSVKELYEKYNDYSAFYLLVDKDVIKTNLYADSMLIVLNGWEKQYGLEYSNALFAKGDAILFGNGYNKAFKYYYDAEHYALENLPKCESYGFSYRLGLVRYKQERYQEAISYIKKAYAEGNNCDDEKTLDDMYRSRRDFLNTIGICFERIGKLDSAIYYYEKELKFMDRYHSTSHTRKDFIQAAGGVVYGNMGGVYMKLGQYGKAEAYLKKSIAINDRPHFAQEDAQTAKLKLADLYFQTARFKEVGKLLGELQLALDEKKKGKEMVPETQLKLYKLQLKYFEHMGNDSEAYQHLQLYYNLRDSLHKVTHNLKVADIDLVFKTNEQQFRLNLLHKENEVKKIYLIAFIIFSLMTTVTLFVLWQSRKKLKALNAKIIGQNTDMQKVLTALEQSQEENTRMMKIVAHDLRSPIAAGISIARLLKTADLPTDDREMLDLLETSSLHSLEMITDLLNVNISSEGLNKEPIELHTLVRYCVNLLSFKANDKLQQLKFYPLQATVLANREKIWRVVSNLIVNAIKFSPKGAVIKIAMFKADGDIVIKIQDQGIGIPIDLQEKIFNIFTDAKRKGTSGEHSYGLGLAISKQIVEAHGGRIWLESEADQGSVFFVSLPLS
jgi:signal transduction histidine kinase